MSDLDDFVRDFLPQQIAAERELHNGNVEPRLELWSTREPVSLLGAWGPIKTGIEDVTQTFRWVASRFSNCESYEFELISADVVGDMAYTVGYERNLVAIDGGPVEPNALRVTHVYRRENGDWKIVHRHGDYPPPDQSPS